MKRVGRGDRLRICKVYKGAPYLGESTSWFIHAYLNDETKRRRSFMVTAEDEIGALAEFNRRCAREGIIVGSE
jgi:hypothetical protein